MFDFIKDHALRNVWCTPDQDNQLIIQPARLTTYGGAKGSYKVIWRNVPLPDTTSQWHVYQIGQVHPLILGLFPKCNEWVSFSETCNRQKMVCDIYNVYGVQIPRVDTFYIHNEDRNLLVAVRKNAKVAFDFNSDAIYLRLYSNHFFNTNRSSSVNDLIHVQGGTFANTAEIIAFQTIYNTYVAKAGHTYCFVNGYKVDAIDIINVKPGDVAEFVYDSSIYKVVDFKIKDLREFNSSLDQKRKYLLHYAGMDNETIDYQDDVDVFVYLNKGSNRNKGLYYHKNNEDALRQLTHRDYSLCVPYLSNYYNELQRTNQDSTGTNVIVNQNEIYVRLHIRLSGYDRSLIYESSKIHELYKMQDEDIQNAILGIDSTVAVWRAEALESSKYSELMRSRAQDITNETVQYAYGYNSITKITADTPQNVYTYSGVKTVDVPYLLQQGCTAYEYNASGHLIGWHVFNGGLRYNCASPLAVKVELIAGIGGNILDESYGFTSNFYNENLTYRFYECSKISGIIDHKFSDVTGVTGKYNIQNGRVYWTSTKPGSYPMMRSDAKFLAYDTEVMMNRGQLKVTLNHLQRRGTVTSNWVMQVPMGELDVFLNNRPLLRNLDYVVRFPEIMIINKEYLNDPINLPQQIHIRHTGFCNSSFQMTEENDIGFVEHGLLSNDNSFDLRDDKVLKVYVDGAMKTRADFTFSELHSGVSILNALNGRPYQIKDMVVPLRGLTREDTYSLRQRSIQTDKIVSEYLSKKIPQPARPAPSAILARYQIFSPFVCKLIYDLADNRLMIADRIHSVQEVVNICKPYESLLAFDPTQEEQKQNSNYVIIHPHSLFTVIQLPLNKYRFVETAVRKYTNGLVSLSPFVQIAP